MAKIIAITNPKNGTGKTVTSINLAASFTAFEKKTLLICMNSESIHILKIKAQIQDKNQNSSIYKCMIEDASIEDIIYPSDFSYLDIIPPHPYLREDELKMINTQNREKRMKEILSIIEKKYDFIIIDCPSSLNLMTINILTAANSLILPIPCEKKSFEELDKLFNTINLIQKRLNTELIYEGILITMYNVYTKFSNLIVEYIKKQFKDIVFKTIIPHDTDLKKPKNIGIPLMFYDVEKKLAQAYLRLAQEIVSKTKI